MGACHTARNQQAIADQVACDDRRPGLKQWPKCGQVKELGEYRKRADAPGGHEGMCKACIAVRKYHVNMRMKNFIGKSLNGTKNGQRWQALVGWTIDELMRHLERRFQKGMTWENYGDWHIDHRIPLAVFNFTKPTDLDFTRAWALVNLQPMWGRENIAKSDTLTRPFQPCLSL